MNRREIALSSQIRLVEILEHPSLYDEKILRSSADHLVKISQRHRLPVPQRARHLFCRQCHVPTRYGENVRIRISGGMKIITCLECSSVRRYGGGPKSHRQRDTRV